MVFIMYCTQARCWVGRCYNEAVERSFILVYLALFHQGVKKITTGEQVTEFHKEYLGCKCLCLVRDWICDPHYLHRLFIHLLFISLSVCSPSLQLLVKD